MLQMLRVAVLAGLLALPAAAETPLSGTAFDALTRGRTLTFAVGGVVYGVEQYLPGRRVIWAFVGEPCRFGSWHEPAPGAICFVYDHDPAPQCWNFFDEGGRLRARFLGEGAGDEVIEVDESDRPLDCPGPRVGA